MTVKIGNIVIFTSPTGGITGTNDWTPLKPEDVPDWLQKPDTLGAMIEGHIAHKVAEGVEPGSPEDNQPYYAAVTLPTKDGAVVAAANDDEHQRANQAQEELARLALPNPRIILPEGAKSLPAGAVLGPTGEAFNEDVALDQALEQNGITRYEMLGDGGNVVPLHPNAAKSPEPQVPVEGVTLTDASPSSTEPTAA